VKFLVKRNLRRECPEQYLAMARRMGEKIASREGKNVYRCILSHLRPAGLEDKPVFMVVEAVEPVADPPVSHCSFRTWKSYFTIKKG
jgi:hypothetical protein